MINYRFLNYKLYSSFKRDLDDKQISQDAIVFIQDESHPCIWTHGKEYLCNVSKSSLTEGLTGGGTLVFEDGFGNSAFTITFNKGNITVTDSKGYSFTTEYLLKSEYNIDSNLDKYSTNPIQNKAVTQALSDKQDKLVAGEGVEIVNNRISSTLDVEPFVILSEAEFPPQNPSSNKIYIVVTPENDTYRYVQYIYRNSQWVPTQDVAPTFDLTGYATTKDIEDMEDVINLLYQKKGDYASKDYVARAIEYVQGVIDRKYVLKKDVYRPADMGDWSIETATPLDITPSESEGNNGSYAHIFLEQTQYESLPSYDNDTIYFIYEESEDQPSGSWEFGDSFPIILT